MVTFPDKLIILNQELLLRLRIKKIRSSNFDYPFGQEGEGTMMEPGRETAMPNLATSLQPRTIPPAQNMKIPPGRMDAIQRQPTTGHPHHYLMPNSSSLSAKHPKNHSDTLFP